MEGVSWLERQEKAAQYAYSLAAASVQKYPDNVKKDMLKDAKAKVSKFQVNTNKPKKNVLPPVVLKAVEAVVVPPAALIPETFIPYTIVPEGLSVPTAALGDGGIPWTYAPMSFVALPAILGALVVSYGRKLVIQMAMVGIEYAGQQILTQRGDPSVHVRWHTGKGEGRGRYVRPRPADGSHGDDDADPHQNYQNPGAMEYWNA